MFKKRRDDADEREAKAAAQITGQLAGWVAAVPESVTTSDGDALPARAYADRLSRLVLPWVARDEPTAGRFLGIVATLGELGAGTSGPTDWPELVGQFVAFQWELKGNGLTEEAEIVGNAVIAVGALAFQR